MQTKENFWSRLCPKLPRIYVHTMAAVLLCAALALPAMAAARFRRWQGAALLAVYGGYLALTCCV